MALISSIVSVRPAPVWKTRPLSLELTLLSLSLLIVAVALMVEGTSLGNWFTGEFDNERGGFRRQGLANSFLNRCLPDSTSFISVSGRKPRREDTDLYLGPEFSRTRSPIYGWVMSSQPAAST